MEKQKEKSIVQGDIMFELTEIEEMRKVDSVHNIGMESVTFASGGSFFTILCC